MFGLGATQSQSGRCSQVTCLCPAAPLLRSRGRVDPLRPLQTPLYEEFFHGSKVLARNQRDGLYHQGTVVHRVQSCRGLWVVEFSSSRQLLCSLDMVRLDQTRLFSVQPGDTVLCPIAPEPRPGPRLGLGPETEPDSRLKPGLETEPQSRIKPGSEPGPGSLRFGPGRLVSLSQEGGEAVMSRVLMWDGRVSLVPLSALCPVSLSQFHRIRRELQSRPAHFTCQSPLCNHGNYSTYQSFLCCHDDHTCLSSLCCCCCCCCQHQSQTWTKPGLTGIEPGLRSSPGSSLDLDRTSDQDEDQAESESTGRSRAREQRPPWRYWRRTGPEPQHKQPGGAVSRRAQVSYVTFPSPPGVSSANHGSVFQPLADHTRGGGLFRYKPRPPQNTANQRPRSAVTHRPHSALLLI